MCNAQPQPTQKEDPMPKNNIRLNVLIRTNEMSTQEEPKCYHTFY